METGSKEFQALGLKSLVQVGLTRSYLQKQRALDFGFWMESREK
jgi:hypothetical protein